MAKRVPAPSPEEIELRAREIRVKWSERETEKRCVYRAKILYTPVPETYFTESTAQHTDFNPRCRILQLD